MKMKKVMALLLGASLFALSACGGTTGPAESKTESKADSAGEKKEISFMIPDWGAPTAEMLADFEKESGIKVNVEEVSWDDIRNKVSIAAGGKQAAADVVELDWSWVGEFTEAGWIAPIELDAADKKDFSAIDTFSVDGKVMGLPYSNDFRVSYYNTEMYEKAGLQEPKTWDEIGTQMKEIKEKGVAEYPFAFMTEAQEGTSTCLTWMTFLRDGKVYNEDGSFNKENVMKSLTFIDEMVKAGTINPANASGTGNVYGQITTGDAAFMTGPSSYVARIQDAEKSQVVGKAKAIVPPGSTGKATQTMALQEGVAVSAYSENKEAAETFAKWYTSQATQEKLFDTNSLIPTRVSALENLQQAGKIVDGELMLEVFDLVKNVYPNGVPAYYTEMSTAMFNAVNKMATGQLNPEQAFDEMNNKLEELRKK